MTSDSELMRALEDCTHPEITHVDHVRLAYAYLKRDSLMQVLDEFPKKLRRYAESKNAGQQFHQTITWMWIFLVSERMQCKPTDSWNAFVEANPDLLESSLVARFYATEQLASPLAREQFVLPAVR